MVDDRCLLLENEVNKLKSEMILLNAKFEALLFEKFAVEDKLMVMRKKNSDLQESLVSQGGVGDGLVDLTGEKAESDTLVNLMIEVKVLECEKKKAESEVEIWKNKFKELEGLFMESGVNSLSRKSDGSRELPEMVKKKMTEATELEDGLANAKSIHASDKLDDGEKKIDLNKPCSTLYYCDKGNAILDSSGTPITPCNVVKGEDGGIISDNKLEYGSRIRKQLFREAGSPNKMAPRTPAGERPASVCIIDIDDSDCESETKLYKTENTMRKTSKRRILEQSDEEDMAGYKGSSLITATKRKRPSNIVTSDSDNDSDNIPICKLKSQATKEFDIDFNLSSFPVEKVEESIAGRCLRLRKCGLKDGTQRSSPSHSGRLTRLRRRELDDKLKSSSPDPSKLKTSKSDDLANEDEEDENMGENESESEGESLGGFIVESSEEAAGSIADSEGGGDSVSGDIANESDSDSEGGGKSVSGDVADESDDDSDGNLDYGDIMSKIQRKRKTNFKWEFEADMLASFGKDPEMCMKAVCAVYRQQTADEKTCRGTLYCNQRGFSQFDASRGTKLAEFLTDGDTKGDLVKSVEELEAHNPKGVELCRKLATRYSKQLFEIYQKKEDPFFLPA